MPRPERTLDPAAGPVAAFAGDLRALRAKAGNPKYLQMARKTGRSRTALADAAGGDRLPTWRTVEAFVVACDADPADWIDRWERARQAVQDAQSAPLRPAASPVDPRPAPAGATVQLQDERPGNASSAGARPSHRQRIRLGLIAAAVLMAGLLVTVLIAWPSGDNARLRTLDATPTRTDFPVAIAIAQPSPQRRLAVITADVATAPSGASTYWLVLRVPNDESPTGIYYYPRFRLPSVPQQTGIRLTFPADSDSTVTRTARVYEVPPPTDKHFEAQLKSGDRQPPNLQPPCSSCISSNEVEIHFLD